jgi:hypothetical protein
VEFILNIEKGQSSNIQEIAKSLEKMGVQVKQVLRMSGVITGVSLLPLAKLKIKGVRSVEEGKRLVKK